MKTLRGRRQPRSDCMRSRPEQPAIRRAAAALLMAIVAAALLFTSGCNARSGFEADAENHTTRGSTSLTAQAADPGISLNCVIEHIQNPPESFHYVYRKDASDHVNEEADISPQVIDGSFTNSSFRRAFHGVHSNAHEWQSAWSGLMGISGMSSAIAVVSNNSATVREPGSSQINGYSAIHYSIDTARVTGVERQILGPAMGPGGFEKGDVWVNGQGCPVKLSLDSELHRNDGSLLARIHYEEAMVRK